MPQARESGTDAPEEILLDANVLAEGQKYFRLGNFAVSPDHRLLAYSTDLEGDETYTIHVKNLDTGELLPDRIANTYYTLEWANDNRTFFYTVLDETKRPYRAFRHELGDASDTLVYEEPDGRFTLGLAKTRSRRFLFIELASPLTSELRYLEAGDPRGEFRVLLPRRQGVEYDASHHGEYFYIRTNEQAKNFRLMRTKVVKPVDGKLARGDPGARRCDDRRCRLNSKIILSSTSASADSRGSASATARATTSTTSSFPSPSTPLPPRATPNTKPICCASTTRRLSRRRRCLTTTSTRASAS